MLVVLIMAGGNGKRFWPLSTLDNPKQFLKFIDKEKSMLTKTIERVLPLISLENVFVGTNESLVGKAIKEVPGLPQENIIAEPCNRNTAAAIGYGIIKIKKTIEKRYKNGYEKLTIIVLPADHLIKDENDFRNKLDVAIKRVQINKSIVTFGIEPNKLETGYGYIELKNKEQGKVSKVERFCEKPSLEKAKEYIEAKNYLWNSGMFVFEAETMLKAFEKYMPEHHKILKKISSEKSTSSNEELKRNFKKFKNISIDFGIMEKTDNIEVIPVDFGWSDVGNFTALDDIFDKNDNGSIERCGELKEYKSGNNIVIGSKDKEIVLIGVEDTVVVETGNKILICKKSEIEKIKNIV